MNSSKYYFSLWEKKIQCACKNKNCMVVYCGQKLNPNIQKEFILLFIIDATLQFLHDSVQNLKFWVTVLFQCETCLFQNNN